MVVGTGTGWVVVSMMVIGSGGGCDWTIVVGTGTGSVVVSTMVVL
jgi:hypothetical protein